MCRGLLFTRSLLSEKPVFIGKNSLRIRKIENFFSNSSKFDDYNAQSKISSSRWLPHYSQIFSKLNYSVYSVYSKLLNICLPRNLSQRHVFPVSYDLIIKSMKRLKSKSCNIDGISVKNIRPDSKELMFHLQLLFHMCLVSSMVHYNFLSRTVTSILKQGKDASACSSYHPITVTGMLSKILNMFYFRQSMREHFMEKISLGSSKE